MVLNLPNVDEANRARWTVLARGQLSRDVEALAHVNEVFGVKIILLEFVDQKLGRANHQIDCIEGIF